FLNGHALSIKRGRKLRFLREICPLKKMTPKSCPVNGTVTGILLTYVFIGRDHIG
ncbi:MAG: hypothetical protein ACI8RD_002520, partial [Bacillariaceae sp.]